MGKPASPIAAWIEENGPELLSFLSRRLNCRTAAADLAQETYLRLHLYAGEAAIENLGAFAFRVAANLATDHQRKLSTRSRFELELEEPELIALVDSGEATPEDILAHRQRLARMQQALAELPLDCRTAFYLNRVQGCTHEEIARRLGISESMVGKHLARALRHCRARAGDA